VRCRKHVFLAAIFLIAMNGCLSVAFAYEPPHNPKKGTLERNQIIAVLREAVQKELKKTVVFRIDALKVQQDWAFLLGVPLEKSGKPLDYRGTKYQEFIESGMFDDWICALLRKQGKRWQVIAYTIGATDVPFSDWAERYAAPKELFQQ